MPARVPDTAQSDSRTRRKYGEKVGMQKDHNNFKCKATDWMGKHPAESRGGREGGLLTFPISSPHSKEDCKQSEGGTKVCRRVLKEVSILLGHRR